MTTPSAKLKSIRMVVKGDVKAWTQKVADLISQGANPRVLDTYRNDQSIIEHYLMSAIDENSLHFVVKFLLDVGVTPSHKIFLDCAMKSSELADLVIDAYSRAMGDPPHLYNVNDLDYYGEPIKTWVIKDILKNRSHTRVVKYLISKGLVTTTKDFSISDIESMFKNLHLHQ